MKKHNKNWRKISLDEERKIVNITNKEKFNDILDEIRRETPSVKTKKKKKINNQEIPITSYGIILVWEEEDSFSYFMAQHRTTIEFANIIRLGPEYDNFYDYLCLITEKERELLIKYSHSKLWDDLLMGLEGCDNLKIQIAEKYKPYEKYMKEFMNLTASQIPVLPYSFPKGRMNAEDQTGLQSALRELKEEANIDLLNDVKKLTFLQQEAMEEIYSGSDGQTYRTIYFVIKSPKKYELPMIYLDTNVISEFALSDDFSNYMWFKILKDTIPMKKTTPLCRRRERMLFSLHRKLCNIN